MVVIETAVVFALIVLLCCWPEIFVKKESDQQAVGAIYAAPLAACSCCGNSSCVQVLLIDFTPAVSSACSPPWAGLNTAFCLRGKAEGGRYADDFLSQLREAVAASVGIIPLADSILASQTRQAPSFVRRATLRYV